jgi:hypothetical protein
MNERVVIVGGSGRGKSTYASKHFFGSPIFCTDKRSEVRHQMEGVTYLPEHVSEEERSLFIAARWMAEPGPWCIEGVTAARALRKWLQTRPLEHLPCDKVIVFQHARPEVGLHRGQAAQAKGTWTVWQEIAQTFAPITVFR